MLSGSFLDGFFSCLSGMLKKQAGLRKRVEKQGCDRSRLSES